MDGIPTAARLLAGDATPVLRRLDNFSQLSESACMALSRVALAGRQTYGARIDLHCSGGSMSGRFLLQGLACDYVLMPDGRRQILNLLMPGDELQGFAIQGRPHNICLLADSVISDVPPAVAQVTMQIDEIAVALRRAAAAANAMREERIISLGRRSAKERLAHLLCEIFHRSYTAGLATGLRCDMPLTQSDLADILGLSLVHVNRSLQLLRAENLLKLEQRSLVILDLPRLEESAQFDVRYLAHRTHPPKLAPFPLAGRPLVSQRPPMSSEQRVPASAGIWRAQ